MHRYGSAFYAYLNSFAVRSARHVVPLVAGALPVTSVMDAGCGQGAWLSVWREHGAEIMGVDGSYVDPRRLLIDGAAFRPADLAAPLDLGRRFDLVQSLEVAEHLPRAHGPAFIRMLTAHADAVLFSAAVPGQGGEHHVNERPIAYWRGLFAQQGFAAVDLVRPALRDQDDVQPWYRCNMILYVNAAAEARLSPEARAALVPTGQALRRYWPMQDRIRQSVVRMLPVPMVDGLAHLNAARLARKMHAA